MATAVQVESIWNGLTDNSGQPLAAGKVYTYSAGTTTPVSLYTSSDKSTSATNPLILDGNGKAQVWADGRYKFVVKTSADVTLYTLDNLLYGFDDTTVLLGGISTGSANAQVVSVPATVESYANGQRITFIAGYTNTGAVTLQFNSLAATSIVKGPTSSSLQAGDLIAGQLYSCTYYGGSFRLENVPTPADVQRSRAQVLASVSGTNTITATASPALTGYEAGEVFRFKAIGANTSAATLNIDGLGAKAIQRYGVALVAGEIQNNDMVEVVYDGTQFQLVNAVPAPLFIDRTNNRVGIGTTAPTYDLEVANTATRCQITRFSNDAGGTQIDLAKSRGATVGTNTIVQSADILGVLRFAGANGTGFSEAGYIAGWVDGIPGATNDMPGRITFATTADGAGTATERMRIDSAGNVGIGANIANTRLFVRGVDATGSNIAFYCQNSTSGVLFVVRNDGLIDTGLQANSPYNRGTATPVNMTVGGDGFLYRNTSGLKYKRDIEDATHGLAEVLQLRAVTYKGKSDIDGNKTFGGLIAEEVHAIGLTEFVIYNADGEPDALGYGNMVSLAFKAIQELNAKVESLEARVAALEA